MATVDQSYYPSAKVRLSIRFEEWGSNVFQGKVPPLPAKNAVGTKGNRIPLRVVEDPEAPDHTKRFLLVALNPSTPGVGTAQTKSADKLSHEIGGIIPKAAEWSQNGVRAADTLKLTIKWVDMPIDPRTIRSCAVAYFLGTVPPEAYAAGVRGAVPQLAGIPGAGENDGSAEPLNVIPDEYTDEHGNVRSNLRFEGWVDKWEMAWSDGEPVVMLECRDNTQLLIDYPQPPRLGISVDKPIDEAIVDYLANFPSMEGISVEYRPTGVRNDTVPPRLKKTLANTAHRPAMGPPAAQGGGGGGESSASIWDYITDVCGAVGHKVRIEGRLIIIQQLAALLDGRAQPRSDDPYRTREVDGASFPVRTLVYGRNIETLKVSREFSKKQPRNIEVRCYDPSQKNVLVAYFPRTPAEFIAQSGPGDGKADQKWVVFRVAGIRDKETLTNIARDIYNSIGRSELELEIATRNLASYGGGNADPDLLDMRVGDNFELLLDRGNDSTFGKLEGQLSAETLNAEFLKGIGYDAGFAAAYAKSYANANFQKAYRVRELSIKWDIDNGVEISLKGANYIEVRLDRPDNAKGQPTSNSGDSGNAGEERTTETTSFVAGNPGTPPGDYLDDVLKVTNPSGKK